MTGRIGQFQFYFSQKEQRILVQKFGITDKKELQKLMKKENLNITTKIKINTKERKEEALSKIAEAKAERIIEKEDKQLHKLNLENEILERTLKYHNTFGSIPTPQAKSAMKKGIENKYGQQNITENIQRKKNFFIDKINSNEYCGCCKICGNFATDICVTSQEAEGDIELHLESIHHQELYVR